MFISLPLSGIYILQKAKKNMIHYLCERTPKGLIYLDKTEPIYVCERTEKMNNKKELLFFLRENNTKMFFLYILFSSIYYIIIIIIKNAQCKSDFH